MRAEVFNDGLGLSKPIPRVRDHMHILEGVMTGHDESF